MPSDHNQPTKSSVRTRNRSVPMRDAPRPATAIAVGMVACCWTFVLLSGNAWAQWPDQHVNGPFHYHADFDLERFHPLLKTVTELQTDIPQQLKIGKVDEPIHLFLFKTQAAYQNYVKTYFPTIPNRPALFVKQRGPGMVFARQSPEFAIDLRHETTHAVLHSVLPMVPLWLDEGLGEYFEMPKASRATDHQHLNAIRSQVRWSRVTDIEQLEKLGDIAEMHGEHYRDSWAWVHFMLHGPPVAREVLVAYLQDIESQVPPGALSRRLKHRIPDLKQQYLLHFRNWDRAAKKPSWLQFLRR